MRKTLVMLLAGGGGTRLNVLAHARAKPAVPFGGMYRIIDFSLSNVSNSGIDRVAVLTQYKPLSLIDHIGVGEALGLFGRTREAKILPPRTGGAESDWYKGTADAIRQNLDYIDWIDPEQVLILSGDQIYFMDYERMLRFHTESDADLTVAMMQVPWEETCHFGVAATNENHRIARWEEKPARAKSNLASLGIYVFRADHLRRMLRQTSEHDFGKGIIPAAVARDRVFAYPFEGYWRDVGTLDAYWRANMDLLDPSSGIELASWRVRTNLEMDGRVGDRPPTLVTATAEIDHSLVSPGCRIAGKVVRSVLSPGVRLEQGAIVSDSVIMHDAVIETGAVVHHGILDKGVRAGRHAVIGEGGKEIPNAEFPNHLRTGLTVVGKKASLPAGIKVGRNSIIHPGLKEGDFAEKEVQPGSTVRASLDYA